MQIFTHNSNATLLDLLFGQIVQPILRQSSAASATFPVTWLTSEHSVGVDAAAVVTLTHMKARFTQRFTIYDEYGGWGVEANVIITSFPLCQMGTKSQ